MIITVDGPAGVGKNTVCELLASRLGMRYLNSGALYRVLGLLSLHSHHPLDTMHLMDLVPDHKITLDTVQGHTRLLLDDVDVTAALSHPDTSHAASLVSKDPKVREYVNVLLQSFFDQDLIIDGRDAGTHIAPNATYKFYLDASPEIRARRRYEQLTASGHTTTYQDVLAQTIERDGMDANKGIYSTQVPVDAIRIATDTLTAYDVVEHILTHIGHANLHA